MVTNTKDAGFEVISVKRNPYLEKYGNAGRQQERRDMEQRGAGRNVSSNGAGYRTKGRESIVKRTQPQRIARQSSSFRRRRARAAKRRQKLQIFCAAVALGIVTLTILGVSLFAGNHHVAAASGKDRKVEGDASIGGNAVGSKDTAEALDSGGAAGQSSDTVVQGIPAEVFARHPEWEENFLTPNEYSRPGDELEEVKNIFVHYTANPGTSAAQNRSYFERQKDEHLASVSAHFIIGYDGEIIQCVPLTEIAYAVQTRNFDSVSIECCYKAKDGSFTKETYQSLIELLAWLTDVYDLDTEDILRHYDCGGKKCPLYYTDHADKWKELKEDVNELKENTGVKL